MIAVVLAMSALAALPDVIDIPTTTQAYDIFGEYALDDGKLFHRAKPSDPWAQVDVPRLPEMKGKLTRVFADGNVVLVVDEADQVFRYDAALHVLDFEPTLYAWRSAWSTRPLVLRHDLRSIAYGRRTILNVGVVEDRFGLQMTAANPSSLISFFHENGWSGLMHFYGLSSDGKRLFFADNGLTDVFNYEFDLPRVDDFVGDAVAASGAMVVVLDTKGRFWAKFLDFDFAGSNPMMFEYTYKDDEKKRRELEGFGRIHIPLPTWRELPPLDAGGGFFSREMGMAVTGKGNNARELRVRGADADGKCGLWTIRLDENVWRFHETGICAKEKFIAAVDVKPVHRGITLRGTIEKYRAQIDDYSLVDSPVRLTLTDPATGNVAFRGQLHLVPSWSPLEPVDPGRDGRYKMFYATVEADQDFADSGFAHEYDLKTFAVTMYGSERDLFVKPLRADKPIGRLGAGDEVTAYLARSANVAAACRELKKRVSDDENQMAQLTATTPFLNAFGLVTGTRFWYYHGISMIPPLGRLMDWGTRLMYDRWQMNRFEMKLVERHCQ